MVIGDTQSHRWFSCNLSRNKRLTLCLQLRMLLVFIVGKHMVSGLTYNTDYVSVTPVTVRNSRFRRYVKKYFEFPYLQRKPPINISIISRVIAFSIITCLTRTPLCSYFRDTGARCWPWMWVLLSGWVVSLHERGRCHLSVSPTEHDTWRYWQETTLFRRDP